MLSAMQYFSKRLIVDSKRQFKDTRMYVQILNIHKIFNILSYRFSVCIKNLSNSRKFCGNRKRNCKDFMKCIYSILLRFTVTYSSLEIKCIYSVHKTTHKNTNTLWSMCSNYFKYILMMLHYIKLICIVCKHYNMFPIEIGVRTI